MVNKCSVPRCRGNYTNGNKVRVFSFPRDQNLLQKWLRAIPRPDFIPTSNTKVCGNHFHHNDFLYEETKWDDLNNKFIYMKFSLPRLKPNAVPSIFPNWPSYMSKAETPRETEEEKKTRLEYKQLATALKYNLEAKEQYDRDNSFYNYSELMKWLDRNIPSDVWTVVKKSSCVLFLNLSTDGAPEIKYSVVVDKNLIVKAYRNGVQLKGIGKYRIPCDSINKGEVLFNILDAFHYLCSKH